MKVARWWWQRRCPYAWYDRDAEVRKRFEHRHYCRMEGDGEVHVHVCDCGAKVDPADHPTERSQL